MPPKTDAERQALRRQRRKEESVMMIRAFCRILRESTDPDARKIALDVLLKTTDLSRGLIEDPLPRE